MVNISSSYYKFDVYILSHFTHQFSDWLLVIIAISSQVIC